jgi:hypothetical protein
MPTTSIEITLIYKLSFAKFIPIIVSILWILFISHKSSKIQMGFSSKQEGS